MDSQYRLQLAESANRISESSAFGLRENLELDRIFVDIALGHGPVDLNHFVNQDTGALEAQVVQVSPSELQAITDFCKTHDLPLPITQNPLTGSAAARARSKQLQQQMTGTINALQLQVVKAGEDTYTAMSARDEIRRIEQESITELSVNRTFKALKQRGEAFMSDVRRLAEKELPEEECTRIFRDGTRLSRNIQDFVEFAIVRRNWPLGLSKGQLSPIGRLNAMTLLKVKTNVLVTGGPGAGKTTLLRRLAQQMARMPSAPLPILLYLIHVAANGCNDLLSECQQQLSKQGYELTKDKVAHGLSSGGFRVFFDGLDETGAEAGRVLAKIQEFAEHYPKANVVVSARDTFEYPTWDNCAHIWIAPFDDIQLRSFLERWFSSQPSQVERLLAWLKENPKMQQAARTPIIATLMCSLVGADADLPNTEVELYEQRFELLLGRWERAKGIRPLPAEVRRRHWHFIGHLAFEMHVLGTRSIDPVRAGKLAESYYSTTYHKTKEGMLADLIHRGVLEENHLGSLSFGHLTYQEFLVARRLTVENPITLILQKISEEWWGNTLKFYASLKGDISGLLEEGRRQNVSERERSVLLGLAAFAPLTSKRSYHALLTQPRV